MDLSKFTPPQSQMLVPQTENRPPHHRGREKFLKGPVPLNWMARAARLPGRALHVGLGLWFLAGLQRHHTVDVELWVMRELGILRDAQRRGIKQLERVGLIAVQRNLGRRLRVTLLGVIGTENSIPIPATGKASLKRRDDE